MEREYCDKKLRKGGGVSILKTIFEKFDTCRFAIVYSSLHKSY